MKVFSIDSKVDVARQLINLNTSSVQSKTK